MSLLACALLTVALRPAAVPAQPPARPAAAPGAATQAAVPDSTLRAVEAYARLQRAINLLRDREQAELAEPRNKKLEEQAAIREKYRALRADSLKAHGFTPAQANAMTLRLSTSDSLRALFERTMERLGK